MTYLDEVKQSALRIHLATKHEVSSASMMSGWANGPDHNLDATELGALHAELHRLEASK